MAFFLFFPVGHVRTPLRKKRRVSRLAPLMPSWTPSPPAGSRDHSANGEEYVLQKSSGLRVCVCVRVNHAWHGIVPRRHGVFSGVEFNRKTHAFSPRGSGLRLFLQIFVFWIGTPAPRPNPRGRSTIYWKESFDFEFYRKTHMFSACASGLKLFLQISVFYWDPGSEAESKR